MKLPRRKFLRLAGSAAALSTSAGVARAQTYPSRPVRLVVGFAAGGSSDIIARLIGLWLSERLGQPVIIENRTGFVSNLAAETVARAAPDGYTLIYLTTPNSINATLYDNLSFDLRRDFVPVAGTIRAPNVMEVNLSVPVQTVPEFIAYAKARPGQINMASTGSGSSLHMAGELFKMMAGVDLYHVPYRSPPQALNDLVAGRVQVMFDVLIQSIRHIRARDLRALAVTTATRSHALPDVPTVAEFLPGYEASAWNGIAAPKGTPADIVERLNQEINAGLADATMQARLLSLGCTIMPGSPADLGNLIASEIDKWASVIKFAGVKAD